MKTAKGWAFPDADQFMVDEMKPDGRYQAGHLDQALTYVTDHGLAIDGGAHVGTWARRMSPVFAQVIAVEPSADTYEALVANMTTFDCRNVDCRPVALGRTSGLGAMVLDGRGLQMRNTGARHLETGVGGVAIEAIDDWGLETLGFLKLDVEGSEVAALEGAWATIQRCRPIVLFEHKHLWRRLPLPTYQTPQAVLAALGYHELGIVGCDRIWGPR